MPADLIVYALVAAGLVFWLRSVLGTRHGEESERPNPYLSGEQDERETDAPSKPSTFDSKTPEAKIAAFVNSPRRNFGVDNKTAENGLIDIAKADKNFDIEFFLEGSQDAFYFHCFPRLH